LPHVKQLKTFRVTSKYLHSRKKCSKWDGVNSDYIWVPTRWERKSKGIPLATL